MRWPVTLSLAVLAASFAAAAPAAEAADPCDSGFFGGPVAVGFQDGAFSIPRRACTRTEVSIGGAGDLIAQPSSFYGNLRAAGLLAGSWELVSGTEIFASAELIRYQTVISSLSADHVGLGHTSIGATHRFLEGEDWTFAATARVTLPTALGLYQGSWPFGLDAGIAAATRLTEAWDLHGYLGLLGSAAATSGPVDPRGGLLLDAGAVWHPLEWFGIVADVEGETFYRGVFDHFAIALGFRFLPADDLGLELLLKSPLAGSERSLVAGFLGLTYRL